MVAFILGIVAVMLLMCLSILAAINQSLRQLVETFTRYQAQSADLTAAYNEARRAQAETAETGATLKTALVQATALANECRKILTAQQADARPGVKH